MSYTGWWTGYGIGILVVLVVVALVTPILLLARSIGKAAPLKDLNTTIEHATLIIAGLKRGRQRLGG